MSRPRSRSPHYRRFPWEEPDFDPYRVLSELDGNPLDRSNRTRDVSEEHWDYFREDVYPKGQRRSPPFLDDYRLRDRHPPEQEEFYQRRLSHHFDVLGCDDRRLSPLRDVGGGEGCRGGFRERLKRFENRGRSPQSPPRLARERSLPTSHSHSDYQQREAGMSWRREEQDRDRGRFRDLSPRARSDDKRGGTGRERGGRRNSQGINRDRRREEPHQEKNPPLKRQRREMDDTSHLGYRDEENFGVKHYSLDTPRDRFGGDRQGSLPHMSARNLGPLVIEHGHGITDSRELPWWEQFEDRRGLDPDFDHQRSPRPLASKEEHFRTSDSRLGDREDTMGYHFQHNLRQANYPEARRSPIQQVKPSLTKYGNEDGPTNLKDRNGPNSARGRLDLRQSGRTGPPRNQPYLQQASRGYQDLPCEEQRTGCRPFKEDCYEDPIEQPKWSENHKQWKLDRPGSLDRYPPRKDLDPKMPRQREHGWNNQKTNNMTVVAEETLTIKVDMNRPVSQNSSLCYSSDRQLSLDLVNVGRQRLDFLPMLEHSGTYRETAMHTGTFAQEIITLVHQVKEQYFRDDGVTLNERFSAPQKGSCSEEELDVLMLDERFTSNRGFSLNMNSFLDDDVPLFSRIMPMQGLNQHPVRDPGDLRHDLERRRQERLEGVKVTIPGNSLSAHSPLPLSELGMGYSDKEEMAQMEDEGFSNWPQEKGRRREGNMRRDVPSRMNTGPQRRNNRGSNRGGQMRRQNNRNNHAEQVEPCS
ncbi:BCLAF1 and THRAP3 family member 3 isoform X2 [Channa argus]|uniref:BCLAF1 and THRAP3 family member 3 isoform X2 n=1 Tax=Channa argus TaxID=215402 RepID=UPI003522FC16